MSQKVTAAIPEGLDLDSDYVIQFTAVDAATGAVVTSVNVSNASLLVANLSAQPDEALGTGPFLLVPGPDS